ncbi:MAG: LolA family protein [Phycisphaerales bacterium]
MNTTARVTPRNAALSNRRARTGYGRMSMTGALMLAAHGAFAQPPAETRADAPSTLAPVAAPPAADTPIPPAQEKPATAAGPYKDAAELLGALESADRDLTTLFADMEYVKTLSDLQGGDQQVHRGKLRYFVRAPVSTNASTPVPGTVKPRRGFAVTFERMIAGGREDTEHRDFIFDGEWYVERDLKNKQFVKRRVVGPGEQADPLRIGEGPFPVPIGQARADILARFDATLVPAIEAVGEEELKRFPKLTETYQLKLVPKPGTIEAKSFAELRLWYRTSDLLPRLARATAPDGSVTDVRLINLKRNQPFDPALISIDRPTEPGWVVSIQDELRSETSVLPKEDPKPAPSENAPPQPPPAPATNVPPR